MQFSLNAEFNINVVLRDLERFGGASIPMLRPQDRERLLDEALGYEYVRKPEIVGQAKVQQDMYGVEQLKTGSLFYSLQNQWSGLLQRKLAEANRKDLFETPLSFNEISIQQYKAGSQGITPHRDSSCNINLICVFNLTGYSYFGLCDNREGTENVLILDDQPGNLIILRAKGFRTEMSQPFHFLRDIPALRISVGFRQAVQT